MTNITAPSANVTATTRTEVYRRTASPASAAAQNVQSAQNVPTATSAPTAPAPHAGGTARVPVYVRNANGDATGAASASITHAPEFARSAAPLPTTAFTAPDPAVDRRQPPPAQAAVSISPPRTDTASTNRLDTHAVSSASVAGPALQPFSAAYHASYKGSAAAAQLTLSRAPGNNRWALTLDVNGGLIGSMQQSTVFEDTDGRWRPQSDRNANQVLFQQKLRTATFDWSRELVRWAGDIKPDRAGPVPLQTGDLTAQLVNLALVRDLAAGRPMSYRLVEDGRVKYLNFSVAGLESITVNGASRQATKVVNSSGTKETFAWIVADMPLPARILQRENGRDTFELKM